MRGEPGAMRAKGNGSYATTRDPSPSSPPLLAIAPFPSSADLLCRAHVDELDPLGKHMQVEE